MKKKLILILLPTVLISLFIFLICYFNIPRLEYDYDRETDSYLVYKAYGNAKSYTVKKTHRGKEVIGVSTRAFFRHSRLEEVIFEDDNSIIFIGRLAFSECPNLKYVDLTNVREIERNAFSYDESLEVINTGAKYIGAAAFYGCISLKEINLNEGVLSIGQNCFSECKSLHEIRLPYSLINLYGDAFSYSGITKVYASIDMKNNPYLESLNYVIYY